MTSVYGSAAFTGGVNLTQIVLLDNDAPDRDTPPLSLCVRTGELEPNHLETLRAAPSTARPRVRVSE